MESQRNSIASVTAFWRECLRSPRSIGSIFPSSASLGRTIAGEVFKNPSGQIIELGAGTGAITSALIDLNGGGNNIIVVERSKKLAKILQAKFLGVQVECCCATEISELDIDFESPITIVSSIPFRSLKQEIKDKIIAEIFALYQKSKKFKLVQYSYFSVCPFAPPKGLVWKKGKIVFSNIPPARIWTLEPARGAGNSAV